MFKHSGLDGMLVILSLAHIACWVVPVVWFDDLSVFSLLILALVNVVLMCTNYQCIAHNFIHNAFFKSRSGNSVFSVVNTLALGMPQSFYKSHHINHHVFNNDDWVGNQPPKDKSSLYLYGSYAQEESLLRYTLLSYFRLSIAELFKDAYQRVGGLVIVEVSALVCAVMLIVVYQPFAFVLFVLPVHYVGTSMASLENYAEHHGCDPANDMSNSVSSYSQLYNLLWFNNGYHQEHHCMPDIHWARLPEVRKKMLDERERKVINGSHFFSVFKEL
ncbi:fatty acid desaturase [Pseudomonas gingeri]|uniref:Fatty acid desaturase n=1 Tax=Pseudomonas gingeri TaxID=117681 RepID=A0A7Y7XH39_9PSED|nr:fatty acid desaturase [Pseudomonas gingeri]NWB99520.1 fatty acid desaturase [Pseudomonas gingeri]